VSAPVALVTFRVADATYGVDVRDVVELSTSGQVTPVPGTSDRVAGVTSWRGRTLAVLRLASDLKREAAAPDQRCRLLVLRSPAPFALRVDAPGQILRDWSPVEGDEARSETGETCLLARAGESLVRVIDPRRLAGDARSLLAGAGPGEA
jgi:chemotaxis signal transduction protein